MKSISLFLAAAAALSLSVSVVEAKDNKGKGGNKAKIEKQVKGKKAIPPGQIKRYTRGQKLPDDLNFKYIDDLDDWKLKPLPPGQRYIRVDDEILSISDDTKTVIDAVGIVGDLLN